MKMRPQFKVIFLFFLFSIFLLTGLSSLSGAQSTPWEYYSNYKIIVPFSWRSLAAKLSFKEEARFKDRSHYYNKIPVGFSTNINKYWEVGFFYALKDKKINSHCWKNCHLIWPEATFHTSLSSIVIDDRQRFEFHLTDRDQRYRNLLRIKFSTLNGKLIPWIGNEVRYFFKKNQIAMNEVLAGIMFKPFAHFTINLYYDYRLIKNNKNIWEKTNVFQSMIILQF